MIQDFLITFAEYWIYTVMSRALLEAVAEELAEVLRSGKEVRSSLNLIEHTTVISRKVLSDAVFTELNFKTAKGEERFPGWTLLPEDKKQEIVDSIDSSLTEALRQIHENAKQAQKYAENTDASVVIWPKTFSDKTPYVKVTSLYPEGSNLEYEYFFRGRKQTGALNSFSGIREIYSKVIKDIFSTINTQIIEYKNLLKNKDPSLLTSDETKFASQRFKTQALGKGKKSAKVALEHIEGTTVNEVTASRADAKLQQLIKGSGLSSGQTTSLIKEFGLEVFLEYKSELDVTSMKVKVGSYKDNASKAAGEAVGLRNRTQVIKLLQKKLENLDLGKFGGSDTRLQIEKKKIVKAFKERVKMTPTTKVKTKGSTKVKTSKQTVKKKVQGKTTRTSNNASFKAGSKKKYSRINTPSGRRSNINLNSLVPAINSRLKEQLVKNMGTPGLQNRSGRFASSVRATDVISTKQGYPSIGYTYQKNPYQIFELGAGRPPWANADRDPRKVIDQSIRDIAKGLIEGRFYTRRV